MAALTSGLPEQGATETPAILTFSVRISSTLDGPEIIKEVVFDASGTPLLFLILSLTLYAFIPILYQYQVFGSAVVKFSIEIIYGWSFSSTTPPPPQNFSIISTLQPI